MRYLYHADAVFVKTFSCANCEIMFVLWQVNNTVCLHLINTKHPTERDHWRYVSLSMKQFRSQPASQPGSSLRCSNRREKEKISGWNANVTQTAFDWVWPLVRPSVCLSSLGIPHIIIVVVLYCVGTVIYAVVHLYVDLLRSVDRPMTYTVQCSSLLSLSVSLSRSHACLLFSWPLPVHICIYWRHFLAQVFYTRGRQVFKRTC